MSGAKTLKLAVLISGNGSNLQALIDACAQDDFPARIGVVLSNRPDALGLERAKKAGLETVIVDHTEFTSREDFDGAMLEALESYAPDLICLAGFMRIVTPVFVNAYAGRILNTHPSLLPKFGGKGMYGRHVHEAVLAAGERESGVSIHSVIADIDQGPVILQKAVPIEPGDTAQSLAARVLEQEHIAYPQAVRMFAEKLLKSA